MSAIMNPLMVGSMLPANNKKISSVFAGSELSFVPTLGAAPQQSIMQDRPTTLFGDSTQHNTTLASPRLNLDEKSNEAVYSPQYQQMHFQVLQQQQVEQQQLQMQQAANAVQAQTQAYALANVQPQAQGQAQSFAQVHAHPQTTSVQPQSVTSIHAHPQMIGVQAQNLTPVHASPQMTGIQQGQNIISAAITKKEVVEGFKNSVVIDLRGEFTSHVLQVTAHGMSAENLKALAERVRRIKKQSDQNKMIQVILFGYLGYLLWRKEVMGKRLYKRLDPILEGVNRDLVMQGINVRFAWTEGELHAYI